MDDFILEITPEQGQPGQFRVRTRVAGRKYGLLWKGNQEINLDELFGAFQRVIRQQAA